MLMLLCGGEEADVAGTADLGAVADVEFGTAALLVPEGDADVAGVDDKAVAYDACTAAIAVPFGEDERVGYRMFACVVHGKIVSTTCTTRDDEGDGGEVLSLGDVGDVVHHHLIVAKGAAAYDCKFHKEAIFFAK